MTTEIRNSRSDHLHIEFSNGFTLSATWREGSYTRLNEVELGLWGEGHPWVVLSEHDDVAGYVPMQQCLEIAYKLGELAPTSGVDEVRQVLKETLWKGTDFEG